jgi:hypothetical protein
MAKAPKKSAKKAPKKSECPPCAEIGAPSAAPDMRAIRGDAVLLSARERSGAAMSERKQKFEYPQFGYYRKSKAKPCAYVKGKPLPPGHLELVMVPDRDAPELGVPAGPALRICLGQEKPGPIISVKDPIEAKAIGDAYKKCAVGEGKDKEACAAKVFGNARPNQPIHIAAAPKRRRRKAK